MSTLDDARAAVDRSDRAQIREQATFTPMATRAETRALRDAMRALIQHGAEMELRIAVLEKAARAKVSA